MRQLGCPLTFLCTKTNARCSTVNDLLKVVKEIRKAFQNIAKNLQPTAQSKNNQDVLMIHLQLTPEPIVRSREDCAEQTVSEDFLC